MITNLQNISSKSFSNYTSNEEFSEVNLLFGINGSGKSALTNWIHANDEVSTSKFDTDFVNNNLRLKDNLDGVKLILGEEVIEREEQINNIEIAISNIEKVNIRLSEEVNSDKEKLYSIIDKTLQDTKKEFKSKRVNHKPNSRDNPLNAVERWKRDSEIKIDISEEISGEELDKNIKDLPNEINTANEKFQWLSSEYQEELQTLFNKKIDKLDEEMNSKLLDWLSKGLGVHYMHGDTENCKFCNQEFEVKEVKDRITKKIDTEYKNSLDKLTIFNRQLENSIHQLKGLSSIISGEELNDVEKLLENLIEKVVSKSQNTEKVIEIADKIKELKAFDVKIINIREKLSDKLDKYRNLSNSIEEVIRKRVGELIVQNSEIDEVIQEINNSNKIIKSNDEAIEDNKKQVGIWHDESSDLEPFKDLVNIHLRKLGLDFNLDISGNTEGYIVRHTNTAVDLRTEDLSEGELRLLGFLYFYHSSFSEINEDKATILSGLKTFVIDDPITSLDNNNRYYITNLINDFVKLLVGNKKQSNIQVFILTHSSIDFHNICYGFAPKRLSRWNIYKNMDGNSEIRLLDISETKNYSDYYKSVMLELMDFAKVSKHKLTGERNFISYGNKGRFILESHARTHYNIENTTSSNIDEIMKRYSIPIEYFEDLKIMLNTINSLSHGISIADDFLSSISPTEVQEAILMLLKILYEKDSHHIDAIGVGMEGYSKFKKDKLI